MDDGLRDLRPYSADDAIGAHEPRGRNGFQQMLRHQSIHGRNTGDVDNGDVRTGLDDGFQQGSA